jgi:hypothetical protein
MAMKVQEAVKEYMDWGWSDKWMAVILKSECAYADGSIVGSEWDWDCTGNGSVLHVNSRTGVDHYGKMVPPDWMRRGTEHLAGGSSRSDSTRA